MRQIGLPRKGAVGNANVHPACAQMPTADLSPQCAHNANISIYMTAPEHTSSTPPPCQSPTWEGNVNVVSHCVPVSHRAEGHTSMTATKLHATHSHSLPPRRQLMHDCYQPQLRCSYTNNLELSSTHPPWRKGARRATIPWIS